jgi:DNA (cytosine-5)-methyltransferase 1
MLEQIIKEKEFGLLQKWPTPVCSPSVTSQTVGATLDLLNSREREQGTLMEAVVKKMFPTPQASDNRDRGNMSNPSIQRRIAKGKQIMLSQSVDQNSGQLNPPWVEWLMGWPIGWTDLKPLETDKSHFVQQQLGDC